jgi:hypothetical protein
MDSGGGVIGCCCMGHLAVQTPGKAISGGFLSKIKNPVKKFDTGFFM